MKPPIPILLFLIFSVLACSLTPVTLPALPSGFAPRPATVAPNTVNPVSTGLPGSLMTIPMQVGYGVRGPFYEIYFTDPFNPEAFREEGGPDLPLVQAIDAARISVEMAAYSLSLYSVQMALIHAYQRGVTVRLVMESDNMGDSAPLALMGAGIRIIGDHRPGLMHDKFVIIDRAEVWTGSMNFTTSGTYEDNNNLIRIRSAEVVEDYAFEFDEMFKRNFFGADTLARTPYPKLTVEGVPLEVYFSPDDHVAQRLVELLRGAQHSIYFLAYSFTANDFGEILLQKARQGLKVSGVMEASQVKSNQGTEYLPLTQAGLPVYLDGNSGQMHHKVMIIDEQIVITGSYNFSSSAERTNDENLLIIFNRQVAAQYLAEFQRVLAEVQP